MPSYILVLSLLFSLSLAQFIPDEQELLELDHLSQPLELNHLPRSFELNQFRQASELDHLPQSLELDHIGPVSNSYETVFRRTRRGKLCGAQFTMVMKKLCGGCWGPEGAHFGEFRKRAFSFIPTIQKRAAGHKCCDTSCSMDYLKSLCC